MSSSFESIHQLAVLAATEFKQAEKKLLLALIEVEKSSVHLRMGFSSLFQYAVSSLGLSEAVAFNAISVARKMREIPELESEVSEIGVSKLRKIVSVLTPKNQSEWISKAKTLSSRALEKEVARVSPRMATPERSHYVSEKRLALKLGVSEELMLKIRRAQDQVSQSLGRAASLEETIEQMASFYLKHKDPLEKARRVIARKGLRSAPQTGEIPAPDPSVSPGEAREEQHKTGTLNKLFTGTVRRPIARAVQHRVRLRDQNQCQAPKPQGGVCGSRRWIDLHHVLPLSEGGKDTPENLITLCRAHHRMAHRDA
jgi:HNH endonuclease